MLSNFKNFIGKAYRWFYYDFLQRTEPFTWQFSRMQEAHPFIFWSIFLGIGGVCWRYIFDGMWWQQGLGIFGLVVGAWFVGHIIDSIQEHGHKPND